MSDNADIANDLAQQTLDLALQNRTHLPVGPSATECKECDEPIPEARRNALPGVELCMSCAQDADLKAMHYRR